MASSSVSAQVPPGTQSTAPGVPAATPDSGPVLAPEVIQRLVDQSTGFNLFTIPDQTRWSNSGGNGVTGVAANQKLHRFDVVLHMPASHGVQSANTVGEV